MFYIISYDIKDDKRRLKVMKLLKNYGSRVQYSVFECILPEEKITELRKKLNDLICKETDSVRIYSIPSNFECRIEIIGVGKVEKDEPYYFV